MLLLYSLPSHGHHPTRADDVNKIFITSAMFLDDMFIQLVHFQLCPFKAFIGSYAAAGDIMRPLGQMCFWTGQFEPTALWNLPGDYRIRGLPSAGIWFYRIKTVILSIQCIAHCKPLAAGLSQLSDWFECGHLFHCLLHLVCVDLKVTRETCLLSVLVGVGGRVKWTSFCCKSK